MVELLLMSYELYPFYSEMSVQIVTLLFFLSISNLFQLNQNKLHKQIPVLWSNIIVVLACCRITNLFICLRDKLCLSTVDKCEIKTWETELVVTSELFYC